MKNIKTIASTVFLNLGCAKLAERFDSVSQSTEVSAASGAKRYIAPTCNPTEV